MAISGCEKRTEERKVFEVGHSGVEIEKVLVQRQKEKREVSLVFILEKKVEVAIVRQSERGDSLVFFFAWFYCFKGCIHAL